MKPITFTTKMTGKVLFSYMMRHTYSSPMGVVGSISGIFLLLVFMTGNGPAIYLFGGIIVLLYLPITLWMSAQRQARLNPSFKEPFHYTLSEEGITVKSGEEEKSFTWDAVVRVVYTGKMIIVYTSKVNAWLFPKEDLGIQAKEVEYILRSKVSQK